MAKPTSDIEEIARRVRKNRHRDTHVALPLPPDRPRVAHALDPVVRGAAPERVVDAIEITKVFNLDDLQGKEEGDGDAPEPQGGDARAHAKRLQSVPLLGSLSKAAFTDLAGAVHRRDLEGGEILFYEGQPARSFFIVAEGELEVVRQRGRRRGPAGALTRAGPSEVLGVFGLFSGRRRAATVRAVGPATVLEVPGTALARLVQRHASARKAVRGFYQQRLLSIFLASAPIFGELPPSERERIAQRFDARDLQPKAMLLAPGEVTNALYLVMNGQVVLRRHRAGGEDRRGEELLRLGRGQFFGVVSALVGNPSAVSASAAQASSLAVLGQRSFAHLLREHPQLEGLPAPLRADGLLVSREIFVGDTGVPGLAGA